MVSARRAEHDVSPLFAVHTAVCAGIAVLGLLSPLRHTGSWFAVAAGLGYAGLLTTIHLVAFGQGRVRFRWPALAGQAVLGFLPALQLGMAWSVLSCFFAGSVLLLAKPLLAVPVLVVVAGTAGVLSAYAGTPAGSVPDGLEGGVFTVVAAMTVFGFAWLVRLADERAASRRELAERVIARERLRFSRDTHDLLGLSLSAITLKGELVQRLVIGDPVRARAELDELLVMSRKALADVRSVAAGTRELSLPEECRSAVTVLRAAGIDVQFDGDLPAHLPAAVATTFATVLRESLTNVVRHSKATWCSFSVRASGATAWLRVANDGVCALAEAESAVGGGSGLRNLGYRVGALGGELTAGVREDGTHRLCATIPLQSTSDRTEDVRVRR